MPTRHYAKLIDLNPQVRLPGTLLASLMISAMLVVPAHAHETPEFLSSPQGKALDLPFSEAVRAGGLLFLSGQIGNKAGSLEVVPGGIEAQTLQTMENIRSVLERHGSSLGKVAKCTVFMADMNDWPRMNAVYRDYFNRFAAANTADKGYPARSALGANGLAKGALLEIECIATTP